MTPQRILAAAVDVSRSTRCSNLRNSINVRKRERENRAILNKTHELKHLNQDDLETDVLKGLWTEQMRVILDGRDGLTHGLISNEHKLLFNSGPAGGGGRHCVGREY